MKPVKILKVSLNMVKHNKLRSWLTIIGIVIGIASVMTIVTMGDYFHEQVTKTLEQLEIDTISIYPSTPQSFYEEEVGIQDSDLKVENKYIEDTDSDFEGKLTKKDIYTLKRIPEIQYINVIVETWAELDTGFIQTDVPLRGVDPGVWGELNADKIEEGRALIAEDRNAIVITHALANDELKDRKIRINQMVLLNNKSYRVAGILEKQEGGIFGEWGDENIIYMPYEEVYDVSAESNGYKEEGAYDSIEITLYDGSDEGAVVDKMDQELQLARRVDEDSKDFQIYANLDSIKEINKLITGLTLFLSLIASISLLVGSVGIANSMFTSVLEKTKQIGIMKAIGARNQEILLIFLCNAALIGLVGGIIGIIIGTVVVQLIILGISMYMDIPFEFTLSLKATFVATLVSIIVGLIAGYMPAKNASKLNPVDALRYE